MYIYIHVYIEKYIRKCMYNMHTYTIEVPPSINYDYLWELNPEEYMGWLRLVGSFKL